MSNCKSCHAPVAWIKTERGKLMAINPGAVVIRSHIPGTLWALRERRLLC